MILGMCFGLVWFGFGRFSLMRRRLPLRGTIPDMTSDSASYITLQRIYFEQAARDTDAVATRVRQLIASVDKVTIYIYIYIYIYLYFALMIQPRALCSLRTL